MNEDTTLEEFTNRKKNNEDSGQSVYLGPKEVTIPKEWKITNIGEQCDTVYRYPTYYDIEYVENGVPEIRPELIQSNGELTTEGQKYRHISEDTAEEYPRTELEPYDFVLSVRGTIGQVGLVRPKFSGANITANLIRLSPKYNSSNPEFLKQTFLFHNFQQLLETYSTRTTIKTITSDALQSIQFRLPPLSEQRKIATVLHTIDRTIGKTEAIVGRLERIHKGLFQSLIPGGIGHEQYDDVRILGRNVQVPTNWDVTTVSEACSDIIDYRGKNPKFSDEGIPHLRNINIGRGELLLDDLKYVSEETYDDWMTKGLPQEGDTLLSTEAPMGKTAVLPEMKFSLSQRLIVLRPGEQFDNQFFGHLMGSPFVQKEYEARATGSTVKGISNYNLQEVTVPVPPREEQKEITQRIGEILETIQINEREINRLNRLKRGIIQDLLSGTVRTTDTNIEVPDEITQHG